MMSRGPVLDAAGAEFRDRPAASDDVLGALLDARDPGQKVLVAGVAVGDQVPGERGGDARRRRCPCAASHGLQERQPPVRGADDQHVRRPCRRLPVLLLRVRLAGLFRRRGRERVLSRTFTGVSSAASTPSRPARRASPRSNPAFPSRALTRATALSTQPADTSAPSSMPMSCADRSGGTFP